MFGGSFTRIPECLSFYVEDIGNQIFNVPYNFSRSMWAFHKVLRLTTLIKLHNYFQKPKS